MNKKLLLFILIVIAIPIVLFILASVFGEEYSQKPTKVQKSSVDSFSLIFGEGSKNENTDKPTGRKLYIFKLELSQGDRVSFDITDYIKDEANKCVFGIPVDSAFYDKYQVGDNILKKMRGGSFLFGGSISAWKIKLVEKYILNN